METIRGWFRDPLPPTVPHAPSLPNPILRLGFSGGFISSRMASKTARNWASYFFSRSASLRARSAFQVHPRRG